MIDKLYIVNERINNLNFLIGECQKAIDNPQPTPENKTPVDLNAFMRELVLRKQVLEIEAESLTNQG